MDRRKFLKDIKKKANEKGLGFVVDKKKGRGGSLYGLSGFAKGNRAKAHNTAHGFCHQKAAGP